MTNNVIITGIPRAGTTLTAALVDSIADSVCLSEPGWQFQWMQAHYKQSGREAFVQWLVEDFSQQRNKLLRGEPINDRRTAEGKLLTNYLDAGDDSVSYDTVPFTRKGLSKDFLLAMKHNGLYLSVLEALAASREFTIIALIRAPVEVMLSWQRVPFPVSKGKLPVAIGYWPEMYALTNQPMEILIRQVKMYDLMCKKLWALKDRIHILKYEELIQHPAMLLVALGREGQAMDTGLIQKSAGKTAAGAEHIKNMFRQHGEYYKLFYSLA